MGEDREHQTDDERDATTTEPADDGTRAEKLPSSESPDDEAYTPLTPTTT
jgi:hypothetical protein